jgi:Tfp pilus assembly protein PilN
MYVASLVCLAVVLAGLEVTYKWNVKKNELEAPLLNP